MLYEVITIVANCGFGGKHFFKHPVVENDGVGTQPNNGGHVMANKKNGSTVILTHILNLTYRFFLEFRIPYGQNFINHQNLGFQMGGHCKSKTNRHPAGIAFHRGINVSLTPAKINSYNFV